jgi:hypothetical protein
MSKLESLALALTLLAGAIFSPGSAVFAAESRAQSRNAEAGAAESAGTVPAFHIGLVTDSGVQAQDEWLGAQEIVRRYGEADAGGLVRHSTYPDNFPDDIGATLTGILKLAEDPLMKVIVVSQAVPGTAEAFRRIRAKRPDIILLAGEAYDDEKEIAAAADLVVNVDHISRGYLIPHSAREMGAKTFVYISFPRHQGYANPARQRAIMVQACADLGLRFVDETIPDPTGAEGVDGARRFIMEIFPAWLVKYGRDTAFFSTNDAHIAPIIRQVANLGGFFVEAYGPSPLLGYPEAFDLNLQTETGDWPAIMREIEEAVNRSGAGGRLGTWAYSSGFCRTVGLAEFGKLIAEGRAEISDTTALLAGYDKISPGAKWHGTYYMDPVTAERISNLLLLYQDTYIFGRGYLGVTKVEIPEKYLLMR